MNRIERIQAMEALLDETAGAVEELADALEAYAKIQAKIKKLSAYYGSERWHADLRADEAGRLPRDLKRGVLSEDLIYDVITANRDNAARMLRIGADILTER